MRTLLMRVVIRTTQALAGLVGLALSLKALVFQVVLGAFLAVTGLLVYALWDSESWGMVDIPPSKVAVRIDYLSGDQTVIRDAGYCFYVPFLQEVELLDRQPQVFQMEGKEVRSINHVQYLTVRAKDGSNFWFESMEIPYQLIPDAAATVLADSGRMESYHRWVGTYARAVLREEFGRLDAQEAASQDETHRAKTESLRRLNEYLLPHGVEVVQITTPKPKFDRDYEKAIYDRKIANQEVVKLGAQIQNLREERGQRLAKVTQDKEVEFEIETGNLDKNRKDAEKKDILLRGQADAYVAKRLEDGETKKAELLAEAQGLRERRTREAQALVDRIAAVQAGGELAVRAALIERLSGIRFTVKAPRHEALAQAGPSAQATGGGL